MSWLLCEPAAGKETLCPHPVPSPQRLGPLASFPTVSAARWTVGFAAGRGRAPSPSPITAEGPSGPRVRWLCVEACVLYPQWCAPTANSRVLCRVPPHRTSC